MCLRIADSATRTIQIDTFQINLISLFFEIIKFQFKISFKNDPVLSPEKKIQNKTNQFTFSGCC